MHYKRVEELQSISKCYNDTNSIYAIEYSSSARFKSKESGYVISVTIRGFVIFTRNQFFALPRGHKK